MMRRLGLCCGLVILLGADILGAAEGPSGPAERPAGTGVIVHPDGYILTAHHVVSNARRIVVVTAGEFRAPAVVVSADPEQDLTLLKIETVGLSEAPVGYAGAVRLDEEVIAVGFPFGLREASVSHGRIAAVRTKGVKRVFQVDAAINPGNSGGPVFNSRGELIGIAMTKFSHPSGIPPEGMGFVVPISYATPLLANIPGFDFAAIGKGRKAPKKKDMERIVREMARTTVRIDAVRFQELPIAPAGSTEPAASQAKGEARRVPSPRPQPGAVQDHGPGGIEDQSAIARVNEQLVTAQQGELQRLAQRGVLRPEGMVLIPDGEFLMGDEEGLPDSRPMRRIYLSSYWIDKHEVTNAQYRQCVQAGVCQFPKDRQAYDDPQRARYPVTNVTWSQARTYCQWSGRRLPTEAEWEKAARGPDGRRYPWGSSEDPIKRRAKEQAQKPDGNGITQVGSLTDTMSPYGVYDLIGNVWEWVKDWYAEDYYAMAPTRDPQGPPLGSFRVLRGGDWSQSPLELRASYRGWDEMSYWGTMLGFRCAADVP
jgi:formylglycine-generating enzyme required for sulfatase activity